MPVCRNWQTRQTQNLLSARVCGFESHYRHHIRTSRLIERYLPWGSYFICINVFFDFYALRKVSKSTAWKLLCKIIVRCWQKCNSGIIKKTFAQKCTACGLFVFLSSIQPLSRLWKQILPCHGNKRSCCQALYSTILVIVIFLKAGSWYS